MNILKAIDIQKAFVIMAVVSQYNTWFRNAELKEVVEIVAKER